MALLFIFGVLFWVSNRIVYDIKSVLGMGICVQKQKFNSLMVALFLSLTTVVSIVITFIYIPNISVLISFMILIAVFLWGEKIVFERKKIIYYIFILSSFLFSLMLNGVALMNYLMHFLSFASVALVLSTQKFSGKLVIKYTIYIYMVYFILYFLVLQYRYNSLDIQKLSVVQMGLAYSLVPSLLFSFSIFVDAELRKNTTVIMKLFAIIVFFCSLYVILFRTITRGALIALFLIGLLLVILQFEKKTRKILFAVLGVFLLLSIFYIDALLVFIGNNFINTDIGAINKLLLMVESGNVANGRDELYLNAINYISSSPFFGHGIGYFEKINGIYVHQMILQILCEFGIIGTLVFIYPLIKYMKYLLSYRSKTEILLSVIIFCNVMVMLQFSSVYWLVPNFWFVYFLSYLNE